MIRLLVLAIIAVGLASCGSSEIVDPGDISPYRLVAYVHGGTPGELASIGAHKLTHINYAFANVTPEGDVVLEDAADPQRLLALVGLREQHPDLKILLSVGGWAWSENFSDAALTEPSRERFAQSAVALVRTHQLDGLDIDWEYPGQRGEDNVFREEDKQTFTLLLQAVRDALDAEGEGYELTIAAAAGQRYLDHTDMAEAHRSLDFVNLMTYDFHGGWSDRTGHHANPHPSAATPGGMSTSRAVEAILAAGVPPDKVVIGAAFYGKGWTGVENSGDGLGQLYAGEFFEAGYGELMRRYGESEGFVRHWDEAAEASTLWNADTQTFITYEDEASVAAKAAYVREQGLGGLMYWQHGHDPEERLLDAARSMLH